MHSNRSTIAMHFAIITIFTMFRVRFSYVGLFCRINCCVIDFESSAAGRAAAAVFDNNLEKNEDRRVDRPLLRCKRVKQRARNLSSLQNVHKPTSQTVSLSSTVPFLDYLMFYVSDSLSTRPINSPASLDARNAYHNTVCRFLLTFDS